MKNPSLKGRETTVGGTIIMPTAINTEATTRSITMKGRKITKPIWKACLTSDNMNAVASSEKDGASPAGTGRFTASPRTSIVVVSTRRIMNSRNGSVVWTHACSSVRTPSI